MVMDAWCIPSCTTELHNIITFTWIRMWSQSVKIKWQRKKWKVQRGYKFCLSLVSAYVWLLTSYTYNSSDLSYSRYIPLVMHALLMTYQKSVLNSSLPHWSDYVAEPSMCFTISHEDKQSHCIVQTYKEFRNGVPITEINVYLVRNGRLV